MRGEVWLLVDSGGIGGIETHIRVLAGALTRAGIAARVLLLAPHGKNPWLEQLEAAGVPYEVLDGRFRTLLRRLRRDRPALLHTHGYKAGILGRFAARLAGVPCVSTFHAGEPGKFPVSLYLRIDAFTSRLGERVAVSAPILKSLPAPVTLIGNFVEVPETPPSTPVSIKVGFVGRLSLEKGPDLFCELAERFAGVLDFEIFGDGPMRAELEAKYGGRVRFHGMVTQPATIWPRIGLLVMPSRAEGLPMAAIEAMSCGVPVAASAVGGLPDLIRSGESGWLFPALDLDSAAGAISAWHAGDAAARAGWSQAAWRTARDGFGTNSKLPQLLAVYEAAIARAGTSNA